MKNPKEHITILMPVYNAAEFAGEAVNSILTQSYPYFELLIIDDGSSDNTSAIIESYNDERIRLISHKGNKGLQYTLNEGIELSSHELIARMDADDISHPWRIEKQVAYMQAHPDCAMVDCWVKVMDKDKKFIRAEGKHSKFVYYTLTFECCIYHPAVLYRKEAVQSVGGYKWPYGEDYDLFWRLSRKYRIHTLEEHLLWYRVHDRNLNTVTKKTAYEKYTRRIWQRNIEYYMGKGVKLPDSWIAAYIYNFKPLLNENNLETMYECISYLDKISKKILSVENPNRDRDAIQYISHFKRQYIINGLADQLPLLKMGSFLLHYHQSGKAVKKILKRMIQSCLRRQ